jgi:hypothetical protein
MIVEVDLQHTRFIKLTGIPVLERLLQDNSLMVSRECCFSLGRYFRHMPLNKAVEPS